MVSPVGQLYLRLLRGVTPGRNRYGAWGGCSGRGWPGPKCRKESFFCRGFTLRRARVKTAAHLHLELGSRYDCRRVGRSGFS